MSCDMCSGTREICGYGHHPSHDTATLPRPCPRCTDVKHVDCGVCNMMGVEPSTARDAEHRAELDEARGLLLEWLQDWPNGATDVRVPGSLAQRTSEALKDAPPPAESTPVQCDEPTVQASPETRAWIAEMTKKWPVDGAIKDSHGQRLGAAAAGGPRYSAPAGGDKAGIIPAPPDDIRERLERLEANVELNAVLCKAATKCTEVGLANVAAALEAKGSDRCARADCGRPRRWGGHEGHHVFVAALEAKGEPGTHAFRCKDRHSKDMADCKTEGFDCVCDCGTKRNEHPKGAKP